MHRVVQDCFRPPYARVAPGTDVYTAAAPRAGMYPQASAYAEVFAISPPRPPRPTDAYMLIVLVLLRPTPLLAVAAPGQSYRRRPGEWCHSERWPSARGRTVCCDCSRCFGISVKGHVWGHMCTCSCICMFTHMHSHTVCMHEVTNSETPHTSTNMRNCNICSSFGMRRLMFFPLLDQKVYPKQRWHCQECQGSSQDQEEKPPL
jgi:hypothetical protein